MLDQRHSVVGSLCYICPLVKKSIRESHLDLPYWCLLCLRLVAFPGMWENDLIGCPIICGLMKCKVCKLLNSTLFIYQSPRQSTKTSSILLIVSHLSVSAQSIPNGFIFFLLAIICNFLHNYWWCIGTVALNRDLFFKKLLGVVFPSWYYYEILPKGCMTRIS